jgi:hypothetical protein
MTKRQSKSSGARPERLPWRERWLAFEHENKAWCAQHVGDEPTFALMLLTDSEAWRRWTDVMQWMVDVVAGYRIDSKSQ